MSLHEQDCDRSEGDEDRPDFITPMSGPEVDPLLSLSGRTGESKSEVAISIMEVVDRVELFLSSNSDSIRFQKISHEWRELIGILNETAHVILGVKASDNEVDSLSDSFELELHRLKVISKAGSLLSFSENFPAFEGGSETRADDELGVALTSLDRCEAEFIEQSKDLSSKSKSLKESLAKEVEYRLRGLNTDISHHAKSESVEFAMSSEPEELLVLRKTNTMRWLNDVLKWQVLDMNTQFNKTNSSHAYKILLEAKKNKIKEILNQKIEKALELKKLQLANKVLDMALQDLQQEEPMPQLTSSISANSSQTTDVPQFLLSRPQMIQAHSVQRDKLEATLILQGFNEQGIGM